MKDYFKKLVERFRAWMEGDGHSDTKKMRNRDILVLAIFLVLSAVCLFAVAEYGEVEAIEAFAPAGDSVGPLTVNLLSTSTSDSEATLVLEFSEPIDEKLLNVQVDVPVSSIDVMVAGNVAVVQCRGLRSGKEYGLNIGGGYIGKNGGRLTETKRFYFSTKGEAAPVPSAPIRPWARLADGDEAAEVLYDDMPVTIDLRAGNIAGNLPVAVHTYAFPSVEKYMEQAWILARYDVDLSFLERLETTVALMHNGDNSVSVKNPGVGAYMLDAVYRDAVTGEDVHVKKPVLVTDLVVYMQTGGPETLAWLNSRSTGGPVQGYTVSFVDEGGAIVSAVTDERGVAIMQHRDLHDSYRDFSEINQMLVTDPDGVPVYTAKTGVLGGESYYSDRERYYSYFYIDRPLYRPTDTISFWGIVKPYHGNREPMPETVTVIFDEGGLDRRVEAKIDPYGCYTGEIPLEQIRSSQYGINVRMDLPPLDEGEHPERDPYSYADSNERYVHLGYEYVDVKEFQKPAFTISSETDKTLYGLGDNVEVTLNAKFYDGTPLPLYELEFGIVDRYGEDRILQRVTTDEDGVAKVTFPANQFIESEIEYSPVRGMYFARIAGDGENIRHVGRYRYFPTGKLMKSAITKRDEGGFRLKVDVSTLGDITPEKRESFEQWERENYYYYDSGDKAFELFRGEPVYATVETEISLRYVDYKGKYHWNDDEKHTLEAVDGVATLNIELPPGAVNGKYVYVYARSVVKEGGKSIISGTSYYEGREPYYSGDATGEEFVPGYSFDLTDNDGASLLGPYISYVPYNDAYVPDKQEMRFNLLNDGEAAENEGRILYTLIQNGVIEQDVITGNSFTLRENVRYAETVNVVAAYFDGRDVHPIRDTMVRFDTNSAKLNIEVTPDKTGYRPGETASLRVKVTDQSGNPVAGNVCVGVVDESVFALREQYINVVSSLYGDMYFYNAYIKKYTTSLGDIPFPGGMDGGKGDGDNAAFYDSFRSNFKDTAAFLPVRTDSAGNATAFFTLPDNTTSWRITAVAVGDNLYGGDSKSNIISTLPFFIKPVMSSKYIAGDEVALLVQGHGPLLDEESDISYTVRIQGDGFDRTMTADGKAYEAKQLNFGVLPEGEYTMTARAAYSGYADTVELPLAVIASNLELVVSREVDLSKPLSINAVRYPVVMSFYDEANIAYFKSVSSLLRHYCMIANQRMSRFVAKRSLMKFMDPADIPQHIRVGNQSASDMQNPDGGIGWYVGEPSEPELTTKVLLVARDQFDLNSMARYYREVLETSRDNNVRASCYLGLAAIGEPVEEEIYGILNNSRPTVAQKAYYIAALAYCGGDARNKAAVLYTTEIEPMIERPGDTCYVKRNTGPIPYLDEKATAAVWIASSILGLPDADGISLYSAQNPWRIGSLFECMIYVTNYDKVVTPKSFDYTVNGVFHNVDLGLGGQRSINFDKSEFESLELKNLPEGVRATAYYIGEPGEAGIQSSDKMKVTKNIRSLGSDKYEIMLTLKFDGTAPEGQYDISDWIPSNMRLYSVRRDSERYIYYSTEGQKIYFTYYRGWYDKPESTISIVYTARKTFDSKAVVDSAYVIHGDSGENCSSERYMLD